MKKIVIGLSAIAVLAAAGAIALVGYVYTRDFGPRYTGRARLDYNLKYFFAQKPEHRYKYSGELFSFTYTSSEPQNPIRAFGNSSKGNIFFDDHYLDVVWGQPVTSSIKTEIKTFLSGDRVVVLHPSAELSQWLLLESDKDYLDFDRVYDSSVERIILSDENPALLFRFRSQIEERPNKQFLVALLPGGVIVKAANTISLNVSERTYRELLSPASPASGLYPDARRDANSANVFAQFLHTFGYAEGKR